MKHTALLAALAAFLIANQSANAQGALNPTGAPAESQKSLQEIYDAIQSARADFEAAKSEFASLVQQAVPSVPGMVTVLGGTLPETSGLAGEVVSTFYIGKYELTWAKWQEVRDWAVSNGYSDLANMGEGSDGNHPVRNVSWYDAVKWCNALSEMESLSPVYRVNGTVYRIGEFGIDGSSVVHVQPDAKGYRLPSEAEWEWAARGGVESKGFLFSGSNDIEEVAWYSNNSFGAAANLDSQNRGTWPVGQKLPNELGIYDMSGNVWEWCLDFASASDSLRRSRSGAWWDGPEWFPLSVRNNSHVTDRYPSQGVRLARSY